MIIIYDLDRTSLYCPIADWMDRFIPKNKALKKLYYKLYPFIHILEMKLGLLQINENMYIRSKQFEELDTVKQVVVTARHYSKSIDLHAKAVFKDVSLYIICVAQGLTGLTKADVVEKLPMDEDEEIVMYDDNFQELSLMNARFSGRFTGIQVMFRDNKEETSNVY